MKKYHILIIIVAAVCAGIAISSIDTVNEYADFSTAAKNEGKQFTVAGRLNNSRQIEYNPKVNPNLIAFYMVDKNGMEMKVLANQAIPNEIDKSENLVVTGKCRDSVFYAQSVLLKCPSKYRENYH